MESLNDIKKLRLILAKVYNRQDLADLLANCTSELEQSSTFGSMSYSVLSTFMIFATLEDFDKLNSLPEEDKKVLHSAVLHIYPLKENSPEVTGIEFSLNFKNNDNNLVTDQLKSINSDYIHEQIKKCQTKINDEDFEGAITNARTLVESICLFIIENQGIEIEKNKKGDLPYLFEKVRNSFNMNPTNHEKKAFKQILQGCITIVQGIAEIRNAHSDAHGKVPSDNYKIDKRHATFMVNLSLSICEYLYSTYQKRLNNQS